MAETAPPQVVRSYLAQLEKSLAGTSAEVREEIIAGVREELHGLDASTAAVRIETLGDPEFIAAEARSAAGTPGPLVEPVETGIDTKAAEPRWLSVLAALLVAVGGVIVPVIGWLVGIALVWMSKTWRRLDKWVATLTPFVASGVLVLVFVLVSAASQSTSPSVSEFGNPLIPGVHSAIWSGIVLAIPVNAIAGIWLLWRAKRAWAQGEQNQR